ncbi:MAG: cytidine deaminase [Acetatifactor sp.]|nr:cytidine deaminase [Acetatifactor sp.]
MDYTNLIEQALEAKKRAYTPYSHFSVGAALLTRDGRIYQGCNIENASYGATNCAERTAFFKAVSEGETEFVAIAIVGGMKEQKPVEYAYPCGICRQVMNEFADADFQVIVAKSIREYKTYMLSDLLPYSFGGEDIR